MRIQRDTQGGVAGNGGGGTACKEKTQTFLTETDRSRRKPGASAEGTPPTQNPTALRIISALPVCSKQLSCCQAYRMTSERSAGGKL